MVHIEVERTIAAAPDRVFSWLADPRNLTAARLMLKAHWVKDSPAPGVGAVREATAAGMWLRERITAYDPPHGYSYLILRAVPAIKHEGGTLTLTPSSGGTRVEWSTTYTHPAYVGGRALQALTAPVLRSGFLEILAGCAKQLEQPTR